VGARAELARRYLTLGGGEPTSGVVAGGVARTAGVCGAAAVACLASGVIGPGIGGVNLLGTHHHNLRRVSDRRRPRIAQCCGEPAGPPKFQASSTRSPASTSSTSETSGKSGGHHATVEAKSSSDPSPQRQVEREFSPFSGGGSASTATPAPASNTASDSSGARHRGGPSSAASSSPAAAGAAKQTTQEFGAFK